MLVRWQGNWAWKLFCCAPTIFPQTFYAGENYYPLQYDELRTELRDEAEHYLEKKAKELGQLGIPKVSYVTPEGSAADEILGLNRKVPDSLIAMCTHGRTGIGRWVLGSVTETVVRHAAGPVLVVRPTS
jgi:nucleotide-binding universal stress UspA family protein